MRRRNAFTIIELLVVIAIIGILAAIIFPVYAQAKKSAYKSSDLSNMNSLRTALQLYKTDNGSYPPALLGYVGPYENGGPNGRNITNGNILPPNAIRDALYPRRVESISIFRPALDRVPDNLAGRPFDPAKINAGTDNMVTTAYWPTKASGTAGSPFQRFGEDTLVQRAEIASGGCTVVNNFYYRVSGYDVAPASNAANAKMETHYQLFWSGWTVPADPCNPDPLTESGSAADTTRQLGYSEPPETTVVTWNPFFRDYVDGAPLHQKQDLVLFLGGSARPMDSASVAASAWAVTP